MIIDTFMLHLAIITFIVFVYLTYRNPLYALAALCALLPSYLLRFEIFGLPSTVLEVIIWAIFFGWLISLLSFPRRRRSLFLLKKRLEKIKWPFALFFISSIIAIIVSPEKISALGIWRAYFLEAGLVFLLLLAIVRDKKDFEKIIFGLSFSALYLSLYAIGQRFFGLPISEPWQKELRVTSLFPYPNALGLFLSPLIILIIGQLIDTFNKKSLTSYFLLLTSLLSISSIIFAHSDGAVFAIIISLFIFIFLNLLLNKKYKSGIAILLLVLIAGGLLFGTLAPIKEKILLKDWSGFVRFTMWGESLNMLKDNFIFGAGLSGFQTKILPYHESREWMEVFLYPHNIILNFWTELGLLGLAAFIWLLEKFGKICYALLKKEKLIAIAAISAMAAVIIHGLVDAPYFKNDLSVLFWVVYSLPLILKE